MPNALPVGRESGGGEGFTHCRVLQSGSHEALSFAFFHPAEQVRALRAKLNTAAA